MEHKLLRDLFCFKCSLQFNGEYVFDLHQKLVHGCTDLDMKKEIKSEKSDPESNTSSQFLPVNEDFKSKDCNVSLSLQGHLNENIESVHEEKKSLKCEICAKSFTQKDILISISNQSMKERSPSNVTFVMQLILKKQHWDEGREVLQMYHL